MALPTLDATFASAADLPRRQMLAKWLVEEKGETQAPSGVLVSGSGSSGVNGVYTETGEDNGRKYYNLLGSLSDQSSISWTGSQWVIWNIGSSEEYVSDDDVEFPWQVTTWAEGDGSIPLPTVTEVPSLNPIANYYDLPERYLWAKIAVAAGCPKTEADYVSLPKRYVWSDIYNTVAATNGIHKDWSEKEALGHIAAAYRGDTANPANLATYISWPWRYQVASIINSVFWNPNEIATIFWYDAADESTITATGNQVTQMLDKSGNGWTVAPITAGKIGPNTGTRTLNGLNVLEYSKTTLNTNQILENDSFNQAQPFCIAIVMAFDDEALADQDFLFSGTESSSPRITVRRTLNAGSGVGDGLQILTNAGSIGTPNGSVPEGNSYLASFYFNTTQSTIRLNGTPSAGPGSIANNSFTSLNIGGNFAEDQSLDGFIAEVLAFADPNDQEIVEGYLAWKWGLAESLPSDHPYKNIKVN